MLGYANLKVCNVNKCVSTILLVIVRMFIINLNAT